MISSAIFSPCGKYRYELRRAWDPSLPVIGWCLKNPSDANADKDDPTSLRVIDFTRRFGGGTAVIVNPRAYVARDPKKVPEGDEGVGPENFEHVRRVADEAAIVVCGWGRGYSPELTAACRGVFAAKFRFLELTLDGEPKHPLYLRANLVPLDGSEPWL